MFSEVLTIGRWIKLYAATFAMAVVVAGMMLVGIFGRRKKRRVGADSKAANWPVEQGSRESDIWQSDATPYCKVCHKTHGASRGDKMCGGPGSWIEDS